MKKKFRLIIFLLIVTVVIFTIYNIYEFNNRSSENQYNELINDLNRDTTDFTSWISNKKEILNTAKDVVDNFGYDEVVFWHTQNPYLNINNDDPNISRIYIGLATGEFITGGDWIPPEDYDPRTRVWYQGAVDAGDTIISDVYIDVETGDRTVTISSPLYMDGSFVGVISADVFMEDISDWLASQITDERVYTYLLDPDGTIIVHTLKSELVGVNVNNIGQVDEAFASQQDILVGYFEEVKQTSQIVRMEYDAHGMQIRGIVKKIEDGEWYLAVASTDDGHIMNVVMNNIKYVLFNLLTLVIILYLLLVVIHIKQELEKQNVLLTFDSERDFLTGIYNRRYFDVFMADLWVRKNDDTQISLLMMDIDDFKKYNDAFGHVKGDEILVKVTDIIHHCIRREDVLARYGGEEFILVLENVTLEAASHIAAKIVKAVYEANIENTSAPTGRITISIGVSTYTGDMSGKSMDVRQFVDLTDAALYAAKEQGRNRFVVSE